MVNRAQRAKDETKFATNTITNRGYPVAYNSLFQNANPVAGERAQTTARPQIAGVRSAGLSSARFSGFKQSSTLSNAGRQNQTPNCSWG